MNGAAAQQDEHERSKELTDERTGRGVHEVLIL